MDRAAAQEAFSEFLSNRSLTTPQIRFIEMVIDQLTARGCHGAVRALRGAVQWCARRRSRGVVRRQEQRDRGDLREVESPSPRTPGRRRLREPVSEVAESLSPAKAEASNHRQNEHAALAGDSTKAVPAGTWRPSAPTRRARSASLPWCMSTATASRPHTGVAICSSGGGTHGGLGRLSRYFPICGLTGDAEPNT